MIEYFVRLVQVHTSFRRAELEALALLAGIDVQIFEYRDEVSWYPALLTFKR